MDLIIGFLAGFAGGLGVGGGGILLLYLTAFSGTDQLAAQGINLVFFLPVAVSALFLHIKNGFVKWKTAVFAILFGIPGVFIGSFLAEKIEPTVLRLIFSLLLLFIGTRELFKKES